MIRAIGTRVKQFAQSRLGGLRCPLKTFDAPIKEYREITAEFLLAHGPWTSYSPTSSQRTI